MTQYKQTEFCLDLRQGNTDSLPTWMKSVNQYSKASASKLSAVQLPLFDLTPYASTPAPKSQAASRGDRNKQAPVSSAK